MTEKRPAVGSLPGEWDPPELQLGTPRARLETEQVHPHAVLAKGVLDRDVCQELCQALFHGASFAPVDVAGRQHTGRPRGAFRASAWSKSLAACLWSHLKPAVEPFRQMGDATPTDWYAMPGRLAHRQWQVVGLSPLLRFMHYPRQGRHIPHYDMGFDYPDARRSLMSMVLFLTSVEGSQGGRLRLIDDGQAGLPMWARVHEDWQRDADPSEVRAAISPRAGDALLFDHRLCHDVETYSGSRGRVVVRGDVVFRALDRGVQCH